MSVAVAEPRKSIMSTFASQYNMEADAFERTLRNTVAKPDRDGREVTREEMAACLVVANQYKLNPFTREVYFFRDPKRGTVVPVVGVDGWARIINEHPAFDGVEFATDWHPNGKPDAVTCTIWRKDRTRQISVTEYFSECVRDTDPWKKSPARMLRHKALIQCARVAFGFAGLLRRGQRRDGRRDAKAAPPTDWKAGGIAPAGWRCAKADKPNAAGEGRSTEAYAPHPRATNRLLRLSTKKPERSRKPPRSTVCQAIRCWTRHAKPRCAAQRLSGFGWPSGTFTRSPAFRQA